MIKNLKKTLFLISLSMIMFPLQAFSADDNVGRYIYSIFSENFNGTKVSYELWKGQSDRPEMPNPASLDNAQHWPATSGAGNNRYLVSEEKYSSLSESKDGNVFWRHNIYVYSGANSAWTMIHFVDGMIASTTPATRSMIDYNGGTLEFWARSNSAQAGTLKIGMKAANANKVVTLASTGFVANGTWQKIIINLSSLYSDLSVVNAPFLVVANGYSSATGILIDFDRIIWRAASGGSFDVNLKNCSDNSDAYEIAWSTSVIGKRWQAANQYIELDLDTLQDDSWGVQIYTNNTDSSAEPKYTGTMTADMASGLVAVSETEKMLPMCWRVTDKLLPYSGTNTGDDYNKTLKIGFNGGGMYDLGSYEAGDSDASSYYCWFAMKDSAMFGLGNADIVSGADYLRVWDKRGFHAAAGDVNYWGMSPGSMFGQMIKPRIYLGADFGLAVTPMEYKTNAIIIELFYE